MKLTISRGIIAYLLNKTRFEIGVFAVWFGSVLRLKVIRTAR